MVDIGLQGPDDYQALAQVLNTGGQVRELHDALPGNAVDLAPQGSDLATLIATLPEPPVNPRISIIAALNSAAGCLLQIVRFIEDDIPTPPVVLVTLARTALIAASRIVFVVGPDDARRRHRNMLIMVRQESDSLMRLYDAAERFQHLPALVPPPQVLVAQRARARQVRQDAPRLGEAETLQESAVVTGQILAERGYGGTETAEQLGEHVAWTFNIYSGAAHGFGWPGLVPGTQSLPGHFIAELYLISNATRLAFDLVARRSSVLS